MRHRRLVILVSVAMGLLLIAAFAGAATQAKIDQAIQDGLAWLATQQYPDGHFGSGYTLANTATAVLAFENEGHFPGGGTAYSGVVEKGLDYIFLFCSKAAISTQIHGDPDTNGSIPPKHIRQLRYLRRYWKKIHN